MTLEIVDLNDTEQNVYEAVVANQPVAFADLLQACVDIDGSQLNIIIKALESRALIATAPGEPARYVAAPPDVALEALLLEKEDQIRRARLLAQRLKGVHGKRSFGAHSSPMIEVVTGRDAVFERYEQALRAAHDEVRVIDRPAYLSDHPEAELDAELHSLRRGVRFRTIYDNAGIEVFQSLGADIRECLDAGEQAKVISEAPMKLALFDDRMAMLPLHAATQTIDSLVVVHPSTLLDALGALFERLWRHAYPLRLPDLKPAPRPSLGPTPQDRLLLDLLTAGLTDQTIARHLGISQRTLQRRVRALFDLLDARTRFQAGLRAVSLGWVSLDPANRPDVPRQSTGSHDAELWMRSGERV